MAQQEQLIKCIPAPRATAEQGGACGAGFFIQRGPIWTMTVNEADALTLASRPFTPAVAGQYFGFAFVTTISIWALAYGAGQLYSFIRKN